MFMKFLSILLFGMCMSLHAKVLSQEAKVTLDMKNVALTTVLEELGKQSKCDFFYNYALMQSKGMVNVKAENLELGKVLEELLPKLGLTFTFDQNVIVIREKVSDEKSKFVRVKGYVYDIHKQGMPGVTVKVAGLPIGTSTNSKGWFVLDLPLQKGSLEFSFVGYKKQIIDFSQKTAQDTLYVTLEEDSQKMEEVVVTGYQTVCRDRRTHLARDLRLHQRRCVHRLHDRKIPVRPGHPPPDGKRGLRLLYDARRRRACGLHRPCAAQRGQNVPEQALRFRRSSQPRPAARRVRFHRNALSGGKAPRNLSHRQQKEFSRHRSLQILRFSSNGRRRYRHRQRLRDERLYHAERPVNASCNMPSCNFVPVRILDKK